MASTKEYHHLTILKLTVGLNGLSVIIKNQFSMENMNGVIISGTRQLHFIVSVIKSIDQYVQAFPKSILSLSRS